MLDEDGIGTRVAVEDEGGREVEGEGAAAGMKPTWTSRWPEIVTEVRRDDLMACQTGLRSSEN